jgi:hypothetical protein
MNCIVHKVEYAGGKVTYTPVGYILDNDSLCDEVNAGYDSTLGSWGETNMSALEAGTKQISEFFDSTPFVHVAKTGVNYSVDLPEITNINQL